MRLASPTLHSRSPSPQSLEACIQLSSIPAFAVRGSLYLSLFLSQTNRTSHDGCWHLKSKSSFSRLLQALILPCRRCLRTITTTVHTVAMDSEPEKRRHSLSFSLNNFEPSISSISSIRSSSRSPSLRRLSLRRSSRDSTRSSTPSVDHEVPLSCV
jgi:hypothetical protein